MTGFRRAAHPFPGFQVCRELRAASEAGATCLCRHSGRTRLSLVSSGHVSKGSTLSCLRQGEPSPWKAHMEQWTAFSVGSTQRWEVRCWGLKPWAAEMKSSG